MNEHVLITGKAQSGEWPVRYVSYSKEDNSLFVMISHSPTWELGDMQTISWPSFVEQHPDAASIAFQPGNHLLSLNSDTGQWEEAR